MPSRSKRYGSRARGYQVRLPLEADEKLYGLGLQLKSFQQRGSKKQLRVNANPQMDSGDSHAPFRALVMDYPGDPEVVKISDQYLMEDSLLVAPVVAGESARSLYLPEGEWFDYGTGSTSPSNSASHGTYR